MRRFLQMAGRLTGDRDRLRLWIEIAALIGVFYSLKLTRDSLTLTAESLSSSADTNKATAESLELSRLAYTESIRPYITLESLKIVKDQDFIDFNAQLKNNSNTTACRITARLQVNGLTPDAENFLDANFTLAPGQSENYQGSTLASTGGNCIDAFEKATKMPFSIFLTIEFADVSSKKYWIKYIIESDADAKNPKWKLSDSSQGK